MSKLLQIPHQQNSVVVYHTSWHNRGPGSTRNLEHNRRCNDISRWEDFPKVKKYQGYQVQQDARCGKSTKQDARHALHTLPKAWGIIPVGKNGAWRSLEVSYYVHQTDDQCYRSAIRNVYFSTSGLRRKFVLFLFVSPLRLLLIFHLYVGAQALICLVQRIWSIGEFPCMTTFRRRRMCQPSMVRGPIFWFRKRCLPWGHGIYL